MDKQNPSIESTLKSMDTEEPIDIYFYRPIGYRVALLAEKLGITPNAITIASLFIGVGAGVCFYFNELWVSVLGIFLLVWANTFDSADGQLARMTKQYSPIGRALDGFAGDLWFIAIYIAICARLYPIWGPWIWLLAAVAGYFHSKQASMADYYRNIHLLFLKGKGGSELDNSTELTEQYKKEKFKNSWINKTYLFFYRSYTQAQENWTPSFQTMFTALKTQYGETPPQSFRDAFRAKSLPLMKYTNILSFNTRAIVLFISILVKQPWIYFVFELTLLNVLLGYMVWTHEKICRNFTKEIEAGSFK